MKKTIAVLFVFLVVAVGCKKQNSTIDYLSVAKSHTWRLMEYLNSDGSLIIHDPATDTFSWTRHITLIFKSDTTFNSQMLVNIQLGYYHINNSNASMNIRLGGSSGAPDNSSWDSLYVATLPLVNSIDVSDTDMKLKYGGTGRYMHYIKN